MRFCFAVSLMLGVSLFSFASVSHAQQPVARKQAGAYNDLASLGIDYGVQDIAVPGAGGSTVTVRHITFPGSGFFDSDQHLVNGGGFRLMLDFYNNYVLPADAATSLLIVAHTDSTADDLYNQQLSERRVQTIAGMLTDQMELDAGRVRTVGMGEVWPASTNATPQGRAFNRRVDFFLSPDHQASMAAMKSIQPRFSARNTHVKKGDKVTPINPQAVQKINVRNGNNVVTAPAFTREESRKVLSGQPVARPLPVTTLREWKGDGI